MSAAAKTKPRMPKARVMFSHPKPYPDYTSLLLNTNPVLAATMPCALIPCRTRKQARLLARFANMTDKQRREYYMGFQGGPYAMFAALGLAGDKSP